jgi:hypothetical protein
MNRLGECAGHASIIKISWDENDLNMTSEFTDISVKGKVVRVPAISMEGYTIVISGRCLRIATIKGETWMGGDVAGDPKSIIAKLTHNKPSADIFAFSQKLPHVQPKYPYPIEWDNVAAIPITTFADWWENRLSQVTRKNVRRSAKRGTTIRTTEFNDELISGIVRINNETPFRDGRPFWHFGKDFETVKRDYSAYLDRSVFLGAYFGDDLIGFIRIIDLGETASIMQLLCKNTHYDKRPANALLARAVELCVDKGFKFLVYGKYVYSDNTDSPLTEFKRRNGFEKFAVPSYFVPLTFKGRLAIKLHAHMGIRCLVPKPITQLARGFRKNLHRLKGRSGERIETEKEDAG